MKQQQSADIKRLQAELAMSRERLSATQEILEVVSQSRKDETPVFATILRRAIELCDAHAAGLILAEAGDPHQRLAAFSELSPETVAVYERGGAPVDPDVSFGAKAILTGEIVHIDDLAEGET